MGPCASLTGTVLRLDRTPTSDARVVDMTLTEFLVEDYDPPTGTNAPSCTTKTVTGVSPSATRSPFSSKLTGPDAPSNEPA